MRLLSNDDQDAIWDRLVLDSNAHSLMPFRLSRDRVGTINGTFEAYYAVLAANFIGGNLDTSLVYENCNLKFTYVCSHSGKELVGALDMGGSSTQLVFHTGTEVGHVIQPEHFWYEMMTCFGYYYDS